MKPVRHPGTVSPDREAPAGNTNDEHYRRGVQAVLSMGGAAALAWGGMVIHNLADLPDLTATGRENTWPGALWLLLFGLWAVLPRARWPATLLWAWGWLNLVGGALSVLPLPIWPYHPEQSLHHYLLHGLYALAQLPLLLRARAERRLRT